MRTNRIDVKLPPHLQQQQQVLGNNKNSSDSNDNSKMKEQKNDEITNYSSKDGMIWFI